MTKRLCSALLALSTAVMCLCACTAGGQVSASGAPEQPLRIVSTDGAETPVEVNPGRTYIAVVGLDMYSYFRINDTAPVWQAAE